MVRYLLILLAIVPGVFKSNSFCNMLFNTVDSKHMAMNHWWRPYGWKENAKTYEAEQLGSLRENLLTSLNAVRE